MISPSRGRCRATSFSSFSRSWNCQQKPAIVMLSIS